MNKPVWTDRVGAVSLFVIGFAASSAAADDDFKYYGSNSCVGCHRNPPPDSYPYAKDFVKLNEFVTWSTQDKHKLAYDNLTSPLGKAMGSRLGLDVTVRDTGCLGCHSAGKAEMSLRVSADQGDEYKRSDGVSCENCHGPAQEWIGPHFQVKWRTTPLAEKVKLGMNDMRDPVSEAKKCLSCHVGSKDELKVVTHAMYAVGHPPLPSMDVWTFSDVEPRHWRTDVEKLVDAKKPVPEGATLEKSRMVVVGATVALETSLKLIADEIAIEKAPEPGLAWPDYARFDCASCHHDLVQKSWRQARGYAGAPGRPTVVRWSVPLVKVGIERLTAIDPAAKALHDELTAHEAALERAVRARPFGSEDELRETAGKYAAWAEGLSKKLGAAKYDKAAVKAMLRATIEGAAKTDLDYDAARDVGWAIKIFHDELGPDPAFDEKFNAVYDRLVKGLNLKLPAGQKVKITDELPRALETMSVYQPGQFKADLAELLPLLK